MIVSTTLTGNPIGGLRSKQIQKVDGIGRSAVRGAVKDPAQACSPAELSRVLYFGALHHSGHRHLKKAALYKIIIVFNKCTGPQKALFVS